MATPARCDDCSGFTLIEVLVAVSIFVVGVLALVQLVIVATDANRSARATTFAVVLAQQKMEQLRSLAWGFDVRGVPVSDTTTDISVVPATSGGSGLSPSPAGALTQNLDGFVDYLDQHGTWVGTGPTPVADTVYIRRWSIEPLPSSPNSMLILQVLVTRLRDRGAANARLPEEARLVAAKSRKTL
ncbi:MAG: type IV pilus modification PilV family protein [Bacteroidales bacterium]